MGDLRVSIEESREKKSTFISHLLQDLAALELMLDRGMIEKDITRIGAEQEFYLTTQDWRPSMRSLEILEAIDDPHFTTELAKFNLEINLDPTELKGDCFKRITSHLQALITKADKVAESFDQHLVLCGILPTISKHELTLDYLTPIPRYRALNNIIRSMRGKDFELYIRGVDELAVIHDSVMFEACTTSFQMHLQIDPDDFVKSYNWAQAIAGPMLGICCNSPLLLGRELWAETRIALFQQSTDLRSSSYAVKNQRPRVTFGYEWAKGGVADIFKSDVANHPVILSKDIENNSLLDIENGNVPRLSALCLHNGTIYNWNRTCYGVGHGKPHVRIECRYIPSGPTIVDSIANFVFWTGLMRGRPKRYDHLPDMMDFKDAKANFTKAARTGKASVMYWDNELISVRDLITQKLLPIASEGLKKDGVDQDDIDYYLDIIEKRATKHTAAMWQVDNLRRLEKKLKKEDALVTLTKAIHKNQRSGLPVHEWGEIIPEESIKKCAQLVRHIMSTELFTVKTDDLADLAMSIMEWKNIHHLPVEDKYGNLKGLITWTHFRKYKEKYGHKTLLLVDDIMAADIITVRPETRIENAIALMKKNEIGCLPVVADHHLVGIITVNDIKPFDHG